MTKRHVRLDDERECLEFYQCSGCHRRCDDPDYDLEMLREAGSRSCCPERNMLYYRNHKKMDDPRKHKYAQRSTGINLADLTAEELRERWSRNAEARGDTETVAQLINGGNRRSASINTPSRRLREDYDWPAYLPLADTADIAAPATPERPVVRYNSEIRCVTVNDRQIPIERLEHQFMYMEQFTSGGENYEMIIEPAQGGHAVRLRRITPSGVPSAWTQTIVAPTRRR